MSPIEAAFPGTTANGEVDREKLAKRVLDDPAAIKKLEGIVHPLVRAAEEHFLTEAERKTWINKLMPVHTEMQSRFGKDFIERIYKASGFTPPQS